MKIRFAFLLVMVGAVATVGSCTKRPLSALVPCTINGVVQNVPVNPQRALDVLFVIDDSLSMTQEQAKVAEQVPLLIDVLVSGGANDPDDSIEEFPAVESLHVGIVTTDLGYSTEPPHSFTPGVDFNPSDACVGSGKAGAMQTEGFIDDDDNSVTPPVACMAQTLATPETPYLEFPATPPNTDDDFVTDVECVTGVTGPGTTACGFEQQLESILASQRNGGNGGFLRQDALLAVILITDEDDCSTTDPRVFDIDPRASNPYQGPFADPGETEVQFNLRCWAHSEALQNVSRYVEEIAALKEDPSQVIFAAITGIPQKAELDRENFDSDSERYEAILADADMVQVPNPADAGEETQELTPSCDAGADGFAIPPVRILETVKGLADAAEAAGGVGVSTVVESICEDDYAPVLGAVVDKIASALRQLCLPRELNRNAEDLVGCEVREVQPVDTDCDESRGRVLVGTEEANDGTTRNVCRIEQLPSEAPNVPTGLGWYYDDFTSDTTGLCTFYDTAQRVAFTENAEPQSGARIRFECLEAAPPQDIDIGWRCAIPADCERSAESLEEQYDRENLSLFCQDSTGTCQLGCDTDAQCPGGFACFDPNDDGATDDAFCVNPTCTLN